jgi:hypothetical protein
VDNTSLRLVAALYGSRSLLKIKGVGQAEDIHLSDDGPISVRVATVTFLDTHHRLGLSQITSALLIPPQDTVSR